MEIVKIRVDDMVVNVSVPKSKNLTDTRERSKLIKKYSRIISKLFKVKQ